MEWDGGVKQGGGWGNSEKGLEWFIFNHMIEYAGKN